MRLAINAQKGLTGVTASAYNVLNGTGNQNGVTAGLDYQHSRARCHCFDAGSGQPDQPGSSRCGGLIDKQGGLSLTNDTGAAITVGAGTGAQIGLVDGTYDGFLALTSADGSEIKTGLTATGTAADLHATGFNISQGSDEITG